MTAPRCAPDFSFKEICSTAWDRDESALAPVEPMDLRRPPSRNHVNQEQRRRGTDRGYRESSRERERERECVCVRERERESMGGREVR
jgi:hypothetical protein